MPTDISPNGKMGKQAARRKRIERLKTERDAIKAALDVWKTNAAYPTDITNAATMIALYREERKMLRDAAQALMVLINARLEEMAEEDQT